MSNDQKRYIEKYHAQRIVVLIIQLMLIVSFLGIWELLSTKEIINPFIFSSPSKVLKTVIGLYQSNNLFIHIKTTLNETCWAFILSVGISFILSVLLYLYKFFNKIIDPFLTCLNSLPKVALGPMIIIICGANSKSIITMAVLINVIVSTIVITNGFYGTDSIKLKLMNTFKASRYQILKYLVIPSSYKTIISSLKLSISMSLIGVITGEFLVSKAGLGYLIIYGTQVFDLNLVVSGIVILLIMSFILYKLVCFLERVLIKDK